MQYDRANVIRNLEDAGCAPDFIIRFMDCLKKGEKEMQLEKDIIGINIKKEPHPICVLPKE